MFTPRWQRVAAAVLLSFCVVHLVATWKSRERIRTGFPDFTIFYTAGTLVRDGMASRLYDADLQYRIQRGFVLATVQGRGLLPYNHPPYEALLFVPLSYLPYLPAYAIWATVNLVLLFLAIWSIQPYLAKLRSLHWSLWTMLPIAFFPAFSTLFEGQDSIVILLLYAVAFVQLKSGKPWHAGVCLALGLFKFQLILPFVALAVLTRCRKLVSGFALASLVLLLANVAMVGWRMAIYYPAFVSNLERTTAGGAIVPKSMPNLHGLVEAMLGRVHAGASLVATIVLSLLLLSVVARRITPIELGLEKNDLCFSLALVVSVLVSYHAYWYDWTVLLLPALLTLNHLGAGTEVRGMAPRALMLSSCALFLSPLYLILLVRFGYTCLLAVLLMLWCWALLREIRKTARPQSSRGHDELQAVVAST